MLSVGNLEAFKIINISAKKRMRAVIVAWLQGKGSDPSWQTLCEALRDVLVDRADVADEIESTYVLASVVN